MAAKPTNSIDTHHPIKPSKPSKSLTTKSMKKDKLHQNDSSATKDGSRSSCKKRSQSLDTSCEKVTPSGIVSRLERLAGDRSRKKSIESSDKKYFHRMERIFSPKCSLEEKVEVEVEDPPKNLTESQKILIKDTWKILEECVAKVGVVMFMGLFETHPDVKEVFFPFRELGKDDLKNSKELRNHGLRVMGFIEKAVRRVDHPDKLIPLVEECGRNHVKYGSKPEYVDLVGPQFQMAIKPILEEHWTPEVEEAWKTLLEWVTYTMKQAMRNKMQSPEH